MRWASITPYRPTSDRGVWSGDARTEIAQGRGVQRPYGGCRREKISGFELDKLCVGGYEDVE